MGRCIKRSCVRARQGDKSVLSLALDLHMAVSGSFDAPREQCEEWADILRSVLYAWESSASSEAYKFDNAVKDLVHAAIAEWDRYCALHGISRKGECRHE